jgi:Na+/H+ antiporter NhaD/arsenite permease-like protein
MPPADVLVLVVFLVVYAGMILGELPGLRLDRAGVALLGAIALVALERVSPSEAWSFVDVSTVALLFGLMVVSAQFRLGGFYSALTRRLAARDLSPERLLAWLVVATGALSAVLANDIVCLAMAPVLVEGAARRRLDPVPFLLGLACAANVGSAATLIGNPQNMLIGQTLALSFAGYLVDAAVPAALGLGIVWWVVARVYRGRWHREGDGSKHGSSGSQPFDVWQTAKGSVVLAAVIIAFLFAPWPREAVALGGAGVLLTSRRMASRDVLGLVDWQLLVLFFGLFVVNGALEQSGMLTDAMHAVGAVGLDLTRLPMLFGTTVVLSNLVSNVPAVMLLLPAATRPLSGPALALASTLAGNLLVVGSIANIIVIDQAARLGVRIDWRTHARVGVPVTLGTLAVAGLWLWLRA